jgi:hypothetical protein
MRQAVSPSWVDTEFDSNCTNRHFDVTNLKHLSVKLLTLTANLIQFTADLTIHFAGKLNHVGDTRGLHETKKKLI